MKLAGIQISCSEEKKKILKKQLNLLRLLQRRVLTSSVSKSYLRLIGFQKKWTKVISLWPKRSTAPP